MRVANARLMSATIASTARFDSGGKWRCAYSVPTASPMRSAASTPRFQRTDCFGVPESVVPKKANASSANACGRSSDHSFSTL